MEKAMHEDNMIRLAHICLRELEGAGLELIAVPNITEFQTRMARIGKAENHPMLSPDWHDFTSIEAFGIVFRIDGDDVGGVAARFIDIGDDSLARHWSATYSRLYNSGAGSPVTSFSNAAAREISGKIVYLGELFLNTANRKGRVNWRLVFHYLFSLAHLKWRPAWTYGFVRQADVLSGKASRYGFTRQHIGPQEWAVQVPSRSSSEYLVALPRIDLQEAAAFYVKHPEFLLDPVPSSGGQAGKQ
ncbi:hypothetical protein [Phaeobacter inhibens]|uniref:hypothetical protein n=1 Tax=Phaeobacter inhibens TaxID=221822 RepID=UPI0021A51609|nr:hypothetical protein [Phaeobacter inhibens]UWR74097.1 hypothetical protein K4L00_08340 [Phaeobacter inhibens]UWR77948.1 hypothetical protein K4L04_08435 [Phaeobacter inhibens]